MAANRRWHPRHGKRQADSGDVHIGILGGSLSGLAVVDEVLRANASSAQRDGRRTVIHIFRNVYDPVEANHAYGKALKPFVDYVPERLGPARHVSFVEQLREWETQGLVEEDAGPVVELKDGKVWEKPGQRFRPRGGLHEMCMRYSEGLADRSTRRVQVRLREEQPWSLRFQPAKGWDVFLGEKGPLETFSFLLLNYDFSARLHHVKAFRELLDTGLPHTSDIVACFGQLHASKSIAVAFTVEPALGDSVPWAAAVVDGKPPIRWVSRVAPCASLAWQRPGAEHWMAFSTSSFGKQRFREGWDKDGAGKQMADAFAEVCGFDVRKRRIRFQARPYHWDLPLARNGPAGQLGVIADAEHLIGWTGDFCVEPTAEGAWLAGRRTGKMLAEALGGGGGLDLTAWPGKQVLLPPWRYHPCREGDEDLAAFSLSSEPVDSAYRGTCNWEAAEQIMLERVRNGSLDDTDSLWLDHLPKGPQQKFSALRQASMRDPSRSLVQQPDPPTEGPGLRVAIVGAGPAAFYCAERLAELALRGQANLAQQPGAIQLFRSRSKMSASQMEKDHNTVFPRDGAPFFDYGCQYLTANSEWFRGKLFEYEQAGICHRWHAGVLSSEAGFEPFEESQFGWVGSAGMWKFQEAVVERIVAAHKPVLKAHHSVAAWPPKPGQRFQDQSPLVCEKFHKNCDGSWTLENRQGDTFGPFDILVGAFASHNHINAQLSASPATARMRDYLHGNLRFSPVITAMVIFDKPLDLSFNAAFVVGDSRLAWMANNNAKVADSVKFRADGREFWTFIAPARYSHNSFERDAKGYKQRAFKDFVNAVSELTGRAAWSHKPQLVRALHWEAGLPCTTIPSDSGCVFDSDHGLGWCGHWATFGGVEGAALSGRKMAELVAGVSRGARPPQEAMYPEGQWPDIGAHTPEGSVRLGHGCFAIQHPRLESIEAPGAESSISAQDTEAFWAPLKAWGFGGEHRSTGQDPNGRGKRKGRSSYDAGGEPEVSSRVAARRWDRAVGA